MKQLLKYIPWNIYFYIVEKILKKYMGRSWLFSITKAWEPSALLHINFFRNSTFDQIFTYLWQIWWTLRTLLFYRTFFIDAYEIRTKRHDKYLSKVNSWVFLHALLLFFRERERAWVSSSECKIEHSGFKDWMPFLSSNKDQLK